MKRFWLILMSCALLCTLVLTGCGGTNEGTEDTSAPETTEPAETTVPAVDITLASGGATQYTIVRGDESSKAETEAAVFLRKYMEKCGLKPKITTDWEKNTVSDFEIVVGATLRTPEQGNTLDPHSVGVEGYYAYSSGTRIYLGGGSDAAVKKGVELFMTKFLGYTGDPESASVITDLTIPAGYAEIVAQEYALKSVTVGGKSLSDYKIVVEAADSRARTAAKTMQEKLYNQCGIWLDLVDRDDTYDGAALILSGEAPAKEGYFEVSVKGDDILMKSGASGGFERGFAQFFQDTFVGKEGELKLDALSYEMDLMSAVTYSQFGAKGDGKTNDMAAIIATHEYANQNGIPVKADKGATYYIGYISAGAVIRTDTDWTGAKFIIDDSVVTPDNGRGVNIFNVQSTNQTKPLTGLTTLKAGQENLGIKLDAPSIVIVNNSNVKQYIREGINANDGHDQTDIILVQPDGSIDPNAPIMWDYDKITSATYLPIDTEVLTIKGGEFTTIANQAPSYYTYYGRGIKITRSNVVVDGLVHYITGEGSHGAPYSGILQISDCANITAKNCVFTAHKTYQSQDPKQASMMGSYDISPSRALNITFENCTQTTDILDNKYWGLMGSNFCKNIVLDGCSFSRFDAHQGVANVTIKNSTLGHQCLNAIGCGTLWVENSTLYGSSFINLRSDYGSTWNGDVVIKNCTWIPNSGKGVSNNAIIGGSYSGFHYFGYECYMPKSITIEGLTVDDSKRSGAYKGIYLLGNIVSSWTSENYEKAVAAKGGYLYHPTEEITISGFSSKSGKGWNLSQNQYMYRNVVVNDLDKAN